MAKKIQTFGYEGLSIAQFIQNLVRSGTQVVIDVRANPLSRKPGFSKKSFQAHLAAAGIQYIHAVGVGCPKPVRDQYKVDRDWSKYTVGYLSFLSTRASDLSAIAAIADDAVACMVCFEADHSLCHRTFVAEALAKRTGVKIEHLKGPATTGSQVRTAA